MKIIKASYDTYKHIKKVDGYIDTGLSAVAFAKNRNAENFLKLSINLSRYVTSNPLLGIFLEFYGPQFSILAEAIDAYEQNNSQLERDLTSICGELDKLASDIGKLLKDCTFDREEFQRGPFYYLAHLQKINPTIPFDTLAKEVSGVLSTVTQMIKNLDNLLSLCFKMSENYEQLYKEAKERYLDRINGRTADSIGLDFNKLFSYKALHVLNLGYCSFLTSPDGFKIKLSKLLIERNNWASWLGIDKKNTGHYLNAQ